MLDKFRQLFLEEKRTIHAINKIPNKYPYAKALLIYSFMERIMKIFLLKYKDDLLDQKTQDDYSSHDEQYFIKEYLTKSAMGTVEALLRKKNKLKIIENKISKESKDFTCYRNDIIHSNLYLRNDKAEAYKVRHKKHIRYVLIALENLVNLNNQINEYFSVKLKGGKIKHIVRSSNCG